MPGQEFDGLTCCSGIFSRSLDFRSLPVDNAREPWAMASLSAVLLMPRSINIERIMAFQRSQANKTSRSCECPISNPPLTEASAITSLLTRMSSSNRSQINGSREDQWHSFDYSCQLKNLGDTGRWMLDHRHGERAVTDIRCFARRQQEGAQLLLIWKRKGGGYACRH